jgi:hypothetical protein
MPVEGTHREHTWRRHAGNDPSRMAPRAGRNPSARVPNAGSACVPSGLPAVSVRGYPTF